MLLWPYNKYPGTDYETFNWEWLIRKMRELWDIWDDIKLKHAETVQNAAAAADSAEAAANSAEASAGSADSAADSADLALERARMGTVKLIEIPGDTVNDKLKYVCEHYDNATIEVGNITVPTTVSVTGTLDIRGVTFIDGVIELENDMFTSESQFAPGFSNVTFIGNGHKIFTEGMYTGAGFDNCNFRNCGVYDKNTGYIQSPYFNMCDVNEMARIFVKAPLAYDVHVDQCRFESSNYKIFDISGSNIFACNGFTFVNSLIEGFRMVRPITISSTFMFLFSGNYCEHNNKGTIEFTSNNIKGAIIGNMFNAPDVENEHVMGTPGIAGTLEMNSNRWNGNYSLTNINVPWYQDVNNQNYVTRGLTSSHYTSTHHAPSFTDYTYDNATHELTIELQIKGSYYEDVNPFIVLVKGEYSANNQYYTGYMVALVCPCVKLVSGAQAATVDVVMLASSVTGSGGSGTLTAEVSNTSPTADGTTITLKTADFLRGVSKVNIIDTKALGTFM